MKKMLAFSAVLMMVLLACKKSNDESQVALTASATQVSVGEQVTVSLSASANASNWTVSPSVSVTKAYGLTTSKVNYFTFNKPGVYTVAVSVKNLAYDSNANQSLDSCWRANGGSRGDCVKGVDSASVAITVKGN